MRRAVILTITVTLAIAAGVIYFVYDPSSSAFFPRCVFLTLTGWQCPGCGSQRAIHALLHGDLSVAWHHNAALLVALPLVGAYLLGEFKRTSWPRYYRALSRPWLVWGILISVVVWWVLRNL